jgi:hypothetical protein
MLRGIGAESPSDRTCVGACSGDTNRIEAPSQDLDDDGNGGCLTRLQWHWMFYGARSLVH